MANGEKELAPINRFKMAMDAPSVQQQFKNALAESAPLFVASLIDLYGSDSTLQQCEPRAVIMEALKAATLKLPINKSLGFAWVIPYGNKPQFQMGYKGYIQLAQRTGQYKFINADVVFEGELKGFSKLTGEVDITGSPESDTVVGYFAYIETLNGFRKTLYWPKERVAMHAARYSKSFRSANSPWKSNFDEMALKTVITQLLSKFGVMSVELISAMDAEAEPTNGTNPTLSDQLPGDAVSPVSGGTVVVGHRYLNGSEIPEGCKHTGAATISQEQCQEESCFAACPGWHPEPGSDG